MWDLDAGLLVVRMLQQDVRAYGYHVAIGGGVVDNGVSNKDLDLYFLPMGGFNDRRWRKDPEGLIRYLENLWGLSASLSNDEYGEQKEMIYKKAVKFFRNKQERIDCFIF